MLQCICIVFSLASDSFIMVMHKKLLGFVERTIEYQVKLIKQWFNAYTKRLSTYILRRSKFFPSLFSSLSFSCSILRCHYIDIPLIIFTQPTGQLYALYCTDEIALAFVQDESPLRHCKTYCACVCVVFINSTSIVIALTRCFTMYWRVYRISMGMK